VRFRFQPGAKASAARFRRGLLAGLARDWAGNLRARKSWPTIAGKNERGGFAGRPYAEVGGRGDPTVSWAMPF